MFEPVPRGNRAQTWEATRSRGTKLLIRQARREERLVARLSIAARLRQSVFHILEVLASLFERSAYALKFPLHNTVNGITVIAD